MISDVASIAYPDAYTSFSKSPLDVSQYKCLIPLAKWYPRGEAISALATKRVAADRFRLSTIAI